MPAWHEAVEELKRLRSDAERRRAYAEAQLRQARDDVTALDRTMEMLQREREREPSLKAPSDGLVAAALPYRRIDPLFDGVGIYGGKPRLPGAILRVMGDRRQRSFGRIVEALNAREPFKSDPVNPETVANRLTELVRDGKLVRNQAGICGITAAGLAEAGEKQAPLGPTELETR